MIPKLLFVLNQYHPPGLKIIFGVSKDTIYHNVLDQLFDFVGTDNYKYNRQNGSLTLFGTNWNVVGAKDEGSEKYIRGRTVGIAYGDEVVLTPRNFLEMMLGRMSSDEARFYGTTNTDSPYHYLYTDFINNPKKKALINSIKFTQDDNYALSAEKRAQYNTMYSGVFHDRYIKGLWVVAEGAIYRDSLDVGTDGKLGENEYDDDTRPISLLSEYVSMYIPIDYGTANPTVFLLVIDDGTLIG
ncbi:unnamed protein product [Sphagnum jensenii]|uniref:Uncharacterized protein n=1 Tax=Sphagnum jensenii TaxID=128206 RepID=A0ABP0V6F4_9BRYO